MSPVEWQLAWYDIADNVVAATGRRLQDLLGFVPKGLDDLSRFPRPRQGWRLVHGELPIPEPGGLSVLAAPWPEAGPAQWALLDVSNATGRPHVATSSPAGLRAGRALRREGLRLEWATDDIVHRAGEQLRARVQVRNTADIEWIGDGLDNDLVAGRISRVDGSPVPKSQSWWGVQVQRLAPIPPMSTRELSVEIVDDVDSNAIPPGEYQLVARLVDLQLSTVPLLLTIVD